MKELKVKLHIIAQEFFQYSLVLYLVLLIVETLQQGFVSNYFNITILLGVVLASGIMMVLTYEDVPIIIPYNSRISGDDIQNGFVAAIVGGFIIFYKARDLGAFSYWIAIISGTIIFFITVFVLFEKKEE